MSDKHLISADDLYKQLNAPDLIIIDCSFDLANVKWGYENYLNGHIPGAYYADLDQNLSSRITDTSGRHPLPDENAFIHFCSNIGIDHNKKVVVYDTESGAYAARLWWLLRSFGHEKTMVLDGGLNAWLERGFLLEKNPTPSQPVNFRGKFSNKYLVTTKQMENMVLNEEYTIIDARSPIRFSGKEEPIDQIAGHIPGAINIFHKENLSENGYFKSDQDLKNVYFQLIENKRPENIIVYCGSGVTSCLDLFALSKLGVPEARLYLGSWSEWIRDKEHPIITYSDDD